MEVFYFGEGEGGVGSLLLDLKPSKDDEPFFSVLADLLRQWTICGQVRMGSGFFLLFSLSPSQVKNEIETICFNALCKQPGSYVLGGEGKLHTQRVKSSG